MPRLNAPLLAKPVRFGALSGALLGALLFGAWSSASQAATAAEAPAKADSKPVAKATAKATGKASPRDRLKDEAKGLALATETATQISAGQLDVAARVLTGPADCEFKQTVSVLPVDGHAGHFHVGFQGKRYTMVPEETATGAVRLEDKKLGVVWLQIPSKSMLMDSRKGQRLVDGCMHSEQRAAVEAVKAAGQSAGSGLGISAPAASGTLR